MLRRRSTIRLRLTALYASTFFIAGAALVALTYWYLERLMHRGPGSGTRALLAQFLADKHVQADDEFLAKLRAQTEHERGRTLDAMLIWFIAALGAVGIAATGFGWLLAGRVLKPLHRVTATARGVADRNLHERIAHRGPQDEIKDLADTFDQMLERLDRSFDGQRRFSAFASHELRTPLTVSRTLLEVALEDPAANDSLRTLASALLDVNHHQERLIDGLLVLASSEQNLQVEPLDLAQVTARALSTAQVPYAYAEVQVYFESHASLVVGDAALLERLAQNIIENALRYNLDHCGWVRIQVANANGEPQLVVENSGPFIDPTQVERLFEPFHRHTTRTDQGTGLGLSIVRSVAEAHGGHVHATARPQGGLTITVTLPAVQ